MKYECKLCNKIFDMKIAYTRHLARKTPCVKKQIKCFKCNRLFNTLMMLKNHLNKKKSCDNDDIYKCKICNKQYITKRNYNKHMKSHQEIVKTNNTETGNIINSNNTNTNSNNSTVNSHNTINYNITINKFGDEDRSFLTEENIKNILNRGFQSIPDLITQTHFNINHPENHNVYITNLSKKTILIYNGERWILTNRDEIIEELLHSNKDFIIDNYDELKNKLTIYAVNRLDRFINEIGNPEYLLQLKDTIQMILYNFRDVVENTRNNIKKLKNIK